MKACETSPMRSFLRSVLYVEGRSSLETTAQKLFLKKAGMIIGETRRADQHSMAPKSVTLAEAFIFWNKPVADAQS
jgi:hypothetical protein